MAQQVKNPPAMQETQGREDPVSIYLQILCDLSLGQEDPLEEETATQLETAIQYSSMKNPMDRGAWRTTIHGVAKNRTRLINQPRLFKSPYCLSSDYLIKSKVLAPPSKTHYHLAWPLFLVLPATIPYHEHDSQTTRITIS